MSDQDKSMNLEIEKLKKQLEDTQRLLLGREHLASIGELIPGITHEINTPLGVAVSAGSFLESQNKHVMDLFEAGKLKRSSLVDYFENVKESTDIINQNLERAVSLIKDIKDISVYQNNGLKVHFNLCEYIEKVIGTLKHEYKRSDHKINMSCHDVMIYSHPGVFSQIMTNLIMNSLTHGFENTNDGLIEIAIDLKKELTLIYKDNGRGIEKEELPHIFDPYYTTRRDDGGTGLGLNIVYRLVTDKLKGHIVCQSKHGEGVIFTITIPMNEIVKE